MAHISTFSDKIDSVTVMSEEKTHWKYNKKIHKSNGIILWLVISLHL